MESQPSWSEGCLEDNMTFIMTHLTANIRYYLGPLLMLKAFVKFFVKWSEMKGSWEQSQTQKHDHLMLERSYFQHFWAKKVYIDVWGFISQALIRNAGWHKLKNTKLGGLSGYWQPGQLATVLWMVETEQITSAISWTDKVPLLTQEGCHVLTVKCVMSVIWAFKDFSNGMHHVLIMHD